MGNIVKANLEGKNVCTTTALFQYDYGQVLQFSGVELPENYEVHFSKDMNGSSVTVIGNTDGVLIPDKYLLDAKSIYAWVFLHSGADDGETKYTVIIPVSARASISDEKPTPVQKSALTEAMALLQTAAENTQMTGATAETDGTSGMTPAPKAGDENKFLRGDGTFAELPQADHSTIGGVKVGAGLIGTNWDTQVNQGKMLRMAVDKETGELYAQVKPLTDGMVWGAMTIDQKNKLDGIQNMTGATPTTDGVAGLVPAPNSLASNYYLRGDGTWDDLRTVIYNCFPVAWAPMDNGVHGWWPYDENGWMIPNDAANNVPPQIMNVALLAGPDTSYDSLTLTFVYLNMIPYGSITIDFVELLGHPYNGGSPVQIDSNGIIINGVRYAKSYNIPMMGSMVVKADQVCSFQIAYRQSPVAVIQSLNNRITALENAST